MYIIKINYFGFGLEPGTETGTYPGTGGVYPLARTTFCPFLAHCAGGAECIFMAFPWVSLGCGWPFCRLRDPFICLKSYKY